MLHEYIMLNILADAFQGVVTKFVFNAYPQGLVWVSNLSHLVSFNLKYWNIGRHHYVQWSWQLEAIHRGHCQLFRDQHGSQGSHYHQLLLPVRAGKLKLFEMRTHQHGLFLIWLFVGWRSPNFVLRRSGAACGSLRPVPQHSKYHPEHRYS